LDFHIGEAFVANERNSKTSPESRDDRLLKLHVPNVGIGHTPNIAKDCLFLVGPDYLCVGAVISGDARLLIDLINTNFEPNGRSIPKLWSASSNCGSDWYPTDEASRKLRHDPERS
jgi:hypothetical protein